MGTTIPIRDLTELDMLKKYYIEKEYNPRNYALISLGFNTALRISDILSLKWGNIYNEKNNKFYSHLTVCEKKTGKTNRIILNPSVISAMTIYINSLSDENIKGEKYIFAGRNENKHLCRSQAFRIIKHACQNLGLSEHISCHSLRKTFGYQAWASGTDATILMIIYNHSSFEITKRYLGIEQSDKDKVFLNINL